MEANQKFQFRTIPRKVYNTETGALTRGYALAYDPTSTDVSAVTTEDKARGKYAINPTSASLFFAGVLTDDKTTTQAKNFVEVAVPGSDPLIYVSESVTAGDIVYFNAGGTLAGQFSKGGIGLGCGSARVHTTRTGAGYVHATLNVGDETGGVQTLAPTTGAVTGISLNGMTLVDGTSVSGGLTYTLADGTFIGQKKGFKVSVLLAGSNDLVITVTNGVQLDGSTALATITLDEAGDQSILEWDGANWKLISNSGGALA